jgi:anti-sigma-K factor RskA
MEPIDKNITSDEALLLAYAAGELAGEELARFETRLAGDPSLRRRADELRSDYKNALQAVASLDQIYHVNERKSLRRIDQLMQQWETEQKPAPAPILLHRWRPPVWSYAAAAIVALLIGFCFWWANNPPASSLVEIPPSTEPTSQQVAVADPPPPSNPAPDANPVPLPLAFQDVSSENSDRLANLESDVVALSNDQLSVSNGSGETNQ